MHSSSSEKWRYTWEGQSHSPNLKLFLFSSYTKPSDHCLQVRAAVLLSKALLTVTWTPSGESQNGAADVSLDVPLPIVLVDPDAPVYSRALEDHVEIKLLLLLPVDHPLTLSELCFNGVNDCNRDELSQTNYTFELKSLNSQEGGVHFYCRGCSGQLTKSSIRRFVEMPSVNWQELADNWFDGCCGSFGRASERLVRRFVDSYACVEGVGYLSSSAVTLCADDVLGFQQIDVDCNGHTVSSDADENNNKNCAQHGYEKLAEDKVAEQMRLLSLEKKTGDDGVHEHLSEETNINSDSCHCHNSHEDEQAIPPLPNLKEDKRSLRDGYLGDGFISKSQNLSAKIKWKSFNCPTCSSFLGAFPCTDEGVSIDKGVRLYKCSVSTSLAKCEAKDHFREYSLEKMISHELIEKEKDELSFKTVVRDLQTRAPLLRLVILNSSSWSCCGVCPDSQSSNKLMMNLKLNPILKIMFSVYDDRQVNNWDIKHQPDELFMMGHMIEQLKKSLESSKDFLPASCKSIQGFSLSSLPR